MANITVTTRIDYKTTSTRSFKVGNNAAASIGGIITTPESFAYARQVRAAWRQTFGGRITREVSALSGAYHATIAGHDYWVVVN